MDVLLVAGVGGEPSQRLAAALAADGHAVRRVDEGGLELALRSGGTDAVVATSDAAVAAAVRVSPTTPAVRWLATPSSDAVADALALGAAEALHDGMGTREVLARLLRVCRGAGHAAVEVGGLHVDPHAGEATWEESRLPLTRRERELLHALALAAGRTVRREALYRQVWGYAMPRGDRTVDVNVRRLRAKLAAAEGVTIETEPGIGYRLVLTAVTAL